MVTPRLDGEFKCPFFTKTSCCQISLSQHGFETEGDRHECMFCNKGWKLTSGEWVEWEKL